MERWVGTKAEAEDPPLAWAKRNSKHLPPPIKRGELYRNVGSFAMTG